MLNKVMIIGNLGKDPERKHFDSGDGVTNFSVATSSKWKDKNTGEMKEKTEWHNVQAFGRLGEVCAEYLHTGSKVYVEGELQTRSWEKDDVKHYRTEIRAFKMQMLDTKKDSGSDTGSYNPGAPHNVTNADVREAEEKLKRLAGSVGRAIPDDDIPF